MRYYLAFHRMSNSQRAIVLQLSHKCRSSECWWSQNTFDHLTLEETSIWSDHITEFRWSSKTVRPVDVFFFILSPSLLAFQRWRWTAGIKTWPSCIIKTVAAGTPAGRTCGELWAPHRSDLSHLKSNVHAGHRLPSFHTKNPYKMWFAICHGNSIYSNLISISLADLRFVPGMETFYKQNNWMSLFFFF